MPAPSTQSPAGFEWPDWMNPILVKELRQSLRSRWFEIIFLSLCGGLTLVTLLHGLWSEPRLVRVIFWGVVVVNLHFLLPLRTALSAADDRHPGNLELIRVTGTSAEKLVHQRITALVFHSAILACIVLPFVILRYFLSGIDLVDELQYLTLLVLSTPVLGLAILWIGVVGGIGRAFLGALFFFLAPAYEVLIGSAAFVPGDAAFLALVMWIFLSLMGMTICQAFATESFLLHSSR